MWVCSHGDQECWPPVLDALAFPVCSGDLGWGAGQWGHGRVADAPFRPGCPSHSKARSSICGFISPQPSASPPSRHSGPCASHVFCCTHGELSILCAFSVNDPPASFLSPPGLDGAGPQAPPWGPALITPIPHPLSSRDCCSPTLSHSAHTEPKFCPLCSLLTCTPALSPLCPPVSFPDHTHLYPLSQPHVLGPASSGAQCPLTRHTGNCPHGFTVHALLQDLSALPCLAFPVHSSASTTLFR